MLASDLATSYRRGLERVYTLLGREYSLLVVVPDQWSSTANSSARELVIAARSIATEGSVRSATIVEGETRRVIIGPVVRVDLNSEQELSAQRIAVAKGTGPVAIFGPKEISAALGGRSIPAGTPLVVAFVGVDSSTVTRLSEGTCVERSDLVPVVTGGFLVLSVSTEGESSTQRFSSVDLCEKPTPSATPATRPRSRAVTTAAVSTVSSCAPKFLVGTEVVDSTRSITYAVRVQQVVIPCATPARPIIFPVSSPSQPPQAMKARAEPLPKPPTRAIRDIRWHKFDEKPSTSSLQEVRRTSAPVLAAPSPTLWASQPQWEKRVQTVVERELIKLVAGSVSTSGENKEEIVSIFLGDGLEARVWPNLVHTIAMLPAWNAVFTHQSVDPTPHKNYEAFETLGDKVLGLALAHHLISSSGVGTASLDSDALTNINKEVLSHDRQAAMAVNMGLEMKGLLRTTVPVEDAMLEDVFEAFFGCLFTVANRIAGGGNQGLPMCEALFKRVIVDTFPDLDLWSIGKDPQTRLAQLFQRLDWVRPNIQYNLDTGVTTIRISREAHTYLESIGPPIKFSTPLAVSSPVMDIKKSEKAAAILALTALKIGWDIDERYVNLVARKKLMKDERYATVQREALEIAKRMGYTDVYVVRKAKFHNSLYAVMGVRPNGSEFQLHVYKFASVGEGVDEETSQNMPTRLAANITALRGFIASQSSVRLDRD